MDGTVVKELDERLRKPFEVGVTGFIARPHDWVLEDPAGLIKPGPTAKALPLSTLRSFSDYVIANRDDFDPLRVVAHIVSPSAASLVGSLREPSRVRETFVSATVPDMTDGFLGRYMAVEEFILGLQVRFEDHGDRAGLLRLLSSVKAEAVKTATDDGMTQVVTTRTGAVLVKEAELPNPVNLMPYRTFREVPQPASPFVLRAANGGPGTSGIPTFALFEADGGAWKLQAVASVKSWLLANLPVSVVVLG